MPRQVLIAGVSTRAAAESAARAGFEVTAIDVFGDRDQHAAVRAIALGESFTASAAAKAAAGVACDAVVYLANFENHPRAIEALAAARPLWGNPPDVIRRVRDPHALAAALAARGFRVPEVRTRPSDAGSGVSQALEQRAPRWLVKPLASGGGQRIRFWDERDIPRGHYLQEYIEGRCGSIAFAAAHRHVAPLGLSWQLVGDPAFGATGFQYCGSILDTADAGGALMARMSAMAAAVAEAFDLVGMNGIDFVASHDVPWAIEVNPRWTASMELLERAYGVAVFEAHAAACADGTLPAPIHPGAGTGGPPAEVRQARGAFGKAIVYARSSVRVGDTDPWLATGDIRDVPHAGTHVPAGRPICSVFAAGGDSATCHRALVRQADRVYEQIESWTPGPRDLG